jgi:hypothetical protein
MVRPTTILILLTLTALLLAPLTVLHAADVPASHVALVTIHPEKPGMEIPADFLGFSFEKKILSIECFQPKNPALINLFTNLGKGVLRIGANEVESTYWSRNETNPPAGMKNIGYSLKPLTIGPLSVDNLYGFARQSGWRVIHGLNLGANDPAMAADEAAYAWQAGGPMVLAFEVGNEPNLYHEGSIRMANYNYAQYRQEFEGYVSAIRSKLPDAPMAGPATTWAFSWFKNFLADFKTRIALATSHTYVLSANETNSHAARFATVENLLSVQTAQNTAKKNWLPQRDACDAAHVPLRIGECNSASGGGKSGVSDVFAAALWSTDFLFDAAEHGVAGINFHGGFGSRAGYSPFCFRHNRYSVNPIYYSMLLFHQAARGRLVSVECQTPANFTAHAVLGDDHKLRVVLINKDLTNSVVASIAAGAPISKAEVIRLSAPSVTSTEGVTLAGSAINEDGTWTPQPGAPVPRVNGNFEVSLPAASAALLTIE